MRLLVIGLISASLMLTGCGGSGNGNQPPIAISNAIFVNKDTLFAGKLNATDPDGNQLTYSIVTDTSIGKLVLTDKSTGAFTYQPKTGITGTDSFTFIANDGRQNSNLAPVTVHIISTDVPIANNDFYDNVDEGGTLDITTGGVLANDSDPGNKALTAVLVSGVSHGTLSLHPDGTFSYTHDGTENFTDGFSYRASNGSQLSNIANVIITVNPLNDPPTANTLNGATNQDIPTTLTLSGSDVDSSSLTFAVASAPAHGALGSINSTTCSTGIPVTCTAQITYTPTANYNGSDMFTFTANDGAANSSPGAATITVNYVNYPPVAKNDVFMEQRDTVNNSLTVLADNGSGPDSDQNGDTLTIIGVGTPNMGGSVSINASQNALLYTPAAGFIGNETFTYTISDGNGGTDTATVTVNIVLNDDFSGGMGNWTTKNDSGLASSWAVVGGELQQQNRVENKPGSFDQSYHTGTYAYYTAGNALTNYRFTTDARYLATGSQDDIGIMFRYQDNNNYYRLSMNLRYGFTRLEKKVGGTFTPLAVNARGYSNGQLLHFTVDANGSLIQIMVNGDPLLAINDSSLSSGSVALYTQDKVSFDNVTVQGAASTPTVTLAAPVADTVAPGSSLLASAIATNVPTGGSVEFLLDSTTSIIDNIFPYTGTFTNVFQGDHTIEAIVRDAANVIVAQDTNTLIGVNGDYYVAIGDSITNGDGDNYASDNQTNRMLGFEGYEANLSALLENSLNIPVIVYNEGIGGDESADAAFSRVTSILARHPDSNKVLVLLGTNDALASIPSGQGCSGSACSGTYKGNMQALLNTLASDGKQAWVARVPPIFGNNNSSPFSNPATASANTNFVQQYNTVINNELTNRNPGPDLYSYFLGAGQNRFSLFANVWHPNGLGHMILSYLWYNVLNPTAQVPLPFVLDNLTPSTVSPYIKQNLLETGDTYYVDNTYTLGAIPPALANGRWIMTDSNGLNNTSTSYITFDMDRAATVYIAYDAGATALPNWMNGFLDTGITLPTSDPFSPILHLYSHTYPAGHVVLGGNLAPGASGANSNYVAIVVPN